MRKFRGLLFGHRDPDVRPHGSVFGWLIPAVVIGWAVIVGVYALLAWLFGWWPW